MPGAVKSDVLVDSGLLHPVGDVFGSIPIIELEVEYPVLILLTGPLGQVVHRITTDGQTDELLCLYNSFFNKPLVVGKVNVAPSQGGNVTESKSAQATEQKGQGNPAVPFSLGEKLQFLGCQKLTLRGYFGWFLAFLQPEHGVHGYHVPFHRLVQRNGQNHKVKVFGVGTQKLPVPGGADLIHPLLQPDEKVFVHDLKDSTNQEGGLEGYYLVFGDGNFISVINWMSKSGGSADESYVVDEIEYINENTNKKWLY